MERSKEERQVNLCVPNRDDSTHHSQVIESVTTPFVPFGTNIVVGFMNSDAESIHRWNQFSTEPVLSSTLPAGENFAFLPYRESQMNVMDISDDDDSPMMMEGRVPAAYQKTIAPQNGSSIGDKSFASRMMAKMGYREGQGLGKDGEGRSTIIEVQQRPLRMGLGVMDPQMATRYNGTGAVVGGKVSKKARKALRAERKKSKESTPRGFREHSGKKSGPNMMPLGAANRIPSTNTIVAEALTALYLDTTIADSNDGAAIFLDGGGENVHPHRLAFLTNAMKLKRHVGGALSMDDHDGGDESGKTRTETRQVEFNGVDNPQIELENLDNLQTESEDLNNIQIESKDLNNPQVGLEDIQAGRQQMCAPPFQPSRTFASPVSVHAEMENPLSMLNQNIKERQQDDSPNRDLILSALRQKNGEGQLSLRSGLVVERGELIHSIIPWNEVRKENDLHVQKDRRGKVLRKKKHGLDEGPIKLSKQKFKTGNKKQRYSKGERKRVRDFSNCVLEMAHSLDRCWLGKIRTTEADLKVEPFRNLSDQASKTFWAEKQQLFETTHSEHQIFQAAHNDRNARNAFEKHVCRYSENEGGNVHVVYGIVEAIKSSENPLVLGSKYDGLNRKVENADTSNEAVVSSIPETKEVQVSSPTRDFFESDGMEAIKGS